MAQFAIDPGAHTQCFRVEQVGGDDGWAERGVAVAGFVFEVGAFVGVTEVVEAPVVGGGDAGYVVPAFGGVDAAGGFADDECDFAFKCEQLGALGAFDGVAGFGD